MPEKTQHRINKKKAFSKAYNCFDCFLDKGKRRILTDITL